MGLFEGVSGNGGPQKARRGRQPVMEFPGGEAGDGGPQGVPQGGGR